MSVAATAFDPVAELFGTRSVAGLRLPSESIESAVGFQPVTPKVRAFIATSPSAVILVPVVVTWVPREVIEEKEAIAGEIAKLNYPMGDQFEFEFHGDELRVKLAGSGTR